jgi:hypothetical protein
MITWCENDDVRMEPLHGRGNGVTPLGRPLAANLRGPNTRRLPMVHYRWPDLGSVVGAPGDHLTSVSRYQSVWPDNAGNHDE